MTRPRVYRTDVYVYDLWSRERAMHRAVADPRQQQMRLLQQQLTQLQQSGNLPPGVDPTNPQTWGAVFGTPEQQMQAAGMAAQAQGHMQAGGGGGGGGGWPAAAGGGQFGADSVAAVRAEPNPEAVERLMVRVTAGML